MPTSNAAKVQGYHDQCPMLREKCRREERVDRQLCRAAHKRRQQDRHLPVTLRWKCPARHDARHRTAKSDEHRARCCARTGRSCAAACPSQTPHAPCIRCPPASDRKKNRVTMTGRKLKHTADTVENAVNHKGMQRLVYVPCGQERDPPRPSDSRMPSIQQYLTAHAPITLNVRKKTSAMIADEARESPCTFR